MDIEPARHHISQHGSSALLAVSAYFSLPPEIKSHRATINPNNSDDQCFKWAVIAALHRDEIRVHPEHVSGLNHYAHLYDWSGLEWPASPATFATGSTTTISNSMH